MKPTLLVLAAGLGSRYGGLKQVDSFGPSGETLLDYTIYDAVKVGFGKIVFVIRSSMREKFIPRMKDNFGSEIELAFVNQELEDLPRNIIKPENRIKPWGTGQAIWSTRREVSSPFCIVNADDFYGRAALSEMYDLLIKMDNFVLNGCMVGYELKDTLSNFGTVSRGICEIENGHLISIKELKEIKKQENTIYAKVGNQTIELYDKAIVSMNLMGFSSFVYSFIEAEFIEFLNDHGNELTSEFYAPSILQALIQRRVKIPVSITKSTWFGVTYPEDKIMVQSKLKEMVEVGEYPNSLSLNRE